MTTIVNPSIEYPYSQLTELMALVINSKTTPLPDNLFENEDMLKQLNTQNDEGLTSLMLACQYSYRYSTESTVQMLINATADLNQQTNGGMTALMIACGNDNNTGNVVRMLINAKANLNQQDNDGMTALMNACGNDKDNTENIIKMLIGAKADLNVQTATGWTALMIACKYNKENAVQILIDAGTDLNLKNISRWTTFMLVCAYSGTIKTKIQQILIDSCEHININELNKLFNLSDGIIKLMENHNENEIIKKYIKHNNYIRIIQHMPLYRNMFKFSFGSIGQKIITYNHLLKQSTPNDIYAIIKEKDPQILDYLTIRNHEEIVNLQKFMDCIY